MSKDVFEAAGSSFNWRGTLAYLDAARAAFWIMIGFKNKQLSTNGYAKYPIEAIPVWVSDVFPSYAHSAFGDPPEPAYEQIIVAKNWLIPGFNQEIVY